MTRLTPKSLLTMSLLAFAGTILYLTLQLSPAARLVPLAIAIATLTLLVFQLILDLAPGFTRKHRLLTQQDVFGIDQLRPNLESVQADEAAKDSRGNREITVLGWILLLSLLIYILGLLVAMPLYTLLYLKRRGEGWFLAIGVSGGLAAALYGLLVELLRAPLFEGRLWILLGW